MTTVSGPNIYQIGFKGNNECLAWHKDLERHMELVRCNKLMEGVEAMIIDNEEKKCNVRARVSFLQSQSQEIFK